MILNDMIYRDHIFEYTTCSLGSVLGNTALGTIFLNRASIRGQILGTHPHAENIYSAPAMMRMQSVDICGTPYMWYIFGKPSVHQK